MSKRELTDHTKLPPEKKQRQDKLTRIKALATEFPLEINSVGLQDSDNFYEIVCFAIGPWVATVLDIKDCGVFTVRCLQEGDPIFKVDDDNRPPCDVSVSHDSGARKFTFPKKTEDPKYFDLSFWVFKSDKKETGFRNLEKNGHGCAGYFQGDKAFILDSAGWLEEYTKIAEKLKRSFRARGFTLELINKDYQSEFGNCAMYSAVCVFLMLIYGQEEFFDHMGTLSPQDKNRLIESIAIKIMNKFSVMEWQKKTKPVEM